METLVAMRERKAPRLSDLKRALPWRRAQYQRRAEKAARGQDRVENRADQKFKSQEDLLTGMLVLPSGPLIAGVLPRGTRNPDGETALHLTRHYQGCAPPCV